MLSGSVAGGNRKVVIASISIRIIVVGKSCGPWVMCATTSAHDNFASRRSRRLWTPIPPAPMAGIELLMKLLIDELVVRGHEVTLFASADCDTSAKIHEVIDVNLTDLFAKAAGIAWNTTPIPRWRGAGRAGPASISSIST